MKSIVIIMGVLVSVFFVGGEKTSEGAETPSKPQSAEQSPTSGPMAVKKIPLPLANGGFEADMTGWKVTEREGLCTPSSEQAASGKYSLKVETTQPGSKLLIISKRVPINGAGMFELRGKYYAASGWGLIVRVSELDANGRRISPTGSNRVHLWAREEGGKWRSFDVPFFTSGKAAFLEVHIGSYVMGKFTTWLDDFELVELKGKIVKPPWQGQYKIRPGEKHRLTPADVVGPDGIVYPNWTKVGVQGGIPDVNVAAKIEDFGGKADDDKDDADALERACASVGEKKGGAVLLGEGTYYLNRQVLVRHDNVVIRGLGADKTRLVFRVPAAGVGLYTESMGRRVGPRTLLKMVCLSKGLKKITMMVDDTIIHEWNKPAKQGEYAFVTMLGEKLSGNISDGPHILKGIAEYADGAKRVGQIPIIFGSQSSPAHRAAVIAFEGESMGVNFRGDGPKLIRDGKRGDTKLHLAGVGGLKAGDSILIIAPATDRWNKLVRNACKWGYYRYYAVSIEKIEGNIITIAQPLRIDFPVVDGSYVRKIRPIRRCGVEDLQIEQVGKIQKTLKINGILFSNAWNCWARGVKVKRPGSHAIYGELAKWCEIRDCVFDNPWFKGGGGAAYAGWDVSFDCLIENIETFRMRHAPCLNWGCSGNVIRKSVFHESDGQWHAGWCNENLFEQCVIESTTRRNNSYGYGLFATPPEDVLHGPIGPRNVVYNCDIFALKGGLWMGGMNENWLILYNRFVADTGQGVFGRMSSFDHIIKGNVFVLKSNKWPMVYLASPDCIGVEIIDNKLYGGNGKFVGGPCKAGVLRGNKAFPLGKDLPTRPKPATPSIYEWQNREK